MSRDPKSPLVAAIDLGTNTALLLVAGRAEDGSLAIVEERFEAPRLGAGMSARDTLDPAARERALVVLERFAARIAELGVERARVRAVATACLRRAADAGDFARVARDRVGLVLEVLSEEEEARLSSLAIEGEGIAPGAVVIDVGGGSTEVACRSAGVLVSAPIGAVVLTERHADGDPPSHAAFERLLADVDAACRAFPSGLSADRATIAVGGTAVHLACLAQRAVRFDPALAEGARIASATAFAEARRLAALPVRERLLSPIEPARADILPAGLACLAGTLQRLRASELSTSSRGLRHGLARDLLARIAGGGSGSRPEFR